MGKYDESIIRRTGVKMNKSMVFYNELMPYQKEVVNTCFDNLKNSLKIGIKGDPVRKFIISPTGSGKTYMAGGFIERAIFGLDNKELSTNIRVLYVTHSLTMANDFKEKFKKFELSIMTHEDIEQKIMKNSDVLLINPEKINSKIGSIAIKKWKEQSSVPVIIVMDEGDITHDGKRNQELLKIISPIYQLAFSATFDVNKDKKDAELAKRLPSEVLKQISVYDVQKSGAIVKGHYVIPETKGVLLDSVLFEAINKLVELQSLSKKLTNYKMTPKMLIQTQAADSIIVKEKLIECLKKMNNEFKKYDDEICIITGELDESDKKDPNKIIYYIGDQKISRGWDNPEVYVLVVDKNSVDIRSGTQLLGRVCRMPHRIHYGDGFDSLNYGYVYVAGSHSIEKSAEQYVAGGILSAADGKNHNVKTMMKTIKRNIKCPIFSSYVVELDGSKVNDELYNKIVTKINNLLISLYKEISKETESQVERKTTVLLLSANENSKVNKESKENVSFSISEDYAISILERALERKIPYKMVADAITRFISNKEYAGWKPYSEEINLMIEKDDAFKFFDLIVNDIIFKTEEYCFAPDKLVSNDSISYRYSLYEKDEMNKEEQLFVQLFLEDFCKDNGFHWVRNREGKDVRLSIGYYPDFIVFNDNEYFFIEYKGNHLENSENSKKKIEYGLNSKIKTIMVVKDGKNSFLMKGRNNRDEKLNLDNLKTIINIE